MPVTTEPAPLEPDCFRTALLAAIAGVRAEDTRLHQLLISGRCPPSLLRRYALATVQSADLFCASLAALADRAPDAHSRLALLENLLEEEGIFLQPARGLVSRPEASHPALARRFAAACGADGDPELAGNALAEGYAGLGSRAWVESVAYLLVGQELNFADTAPRLAEALRKCGLSARDVAFFSVHETADRQHGEQALNLVIRHASGRAQQDRCIAEARAGATAWIGAHGGLVH